MMSWLTPAHMMNWLIQAAAIPAPSAPPADTATPSASPFPQVDPALSQGSGIELILIVVAGILTLALLAFFAYVFTRKSEER